MKAHYATEHGSWLKGQGSGTQARINQQKRGVQRGMCTSDVFLI